MEAEFVRLSQILESDAAKREEIYKECKELNRVHRSIQFTLFNVHNVVKDEDGIIAVCRTARSQFAELLPHWNKIATIIGTNECVEKYRHTWHHALEQLVFLASFAHYMDTGRLISLSEAVTLIGVGNNPIYAVPSIPTDDSNVDASSSSSSSSESSSASSSSSIHCIGLDIDVYLQGLTALPKELCRLCINAVRSSNYSLPSRVSSFVSELYSSFRLLNLKNDALRRKFDAIKYDMNKIDEIMYDIKVRGLGANKDDDAKEVNATTKPLAVNSSDEAMM